MKTKRLNLNQKIIIVCLILLTVSISFNKNVTSKDSMTSVEAVGLTSKDLYGKRFIVVYGDYVIAVDNIGKGGYVYNSSNNRQYFWYSQQFYKDLIKESKCLSHIPQKFDGNAYLLKCSNCGQKSFDTEYLSNSWQKIKGVKGRLDSSMVIVFIPSDK